MNFSSTEIALIGTEHNVLVKETIDDIVDNGEMDVRGSLNETFVAHSYDQLDPDEYTINYNLFAEPYVVNSVNDIIDSIYNPVQRQIMDDMVSIVENENDLTTKLAELASLKQYATDNLTEFEQAQTLISIEVCINSAKLWFPTDQGGQGYYDIVNTYIGNLRSGNRMSASGTVGTIVIADAVGAFSGFLNGAMGYLLSGGAANPVSNAYLLGRTVLGAVTGSVNAGIGAAIRAHSH